MAVSLADAAGKPHTLSLCLTKRPLMDRVCERLDTAHVRIVRIHRCRARFGLGILDAEIGGPFR